LENGYLLPQYYACEFEIKDKTYIKYAYVIIEQSMKTSKKKEKERKTT
jgi:hypothetical protein